MADFSTYSVTVDGEAEAWRVARLLLHFSQWFAITPLGGDLWMVEVKEENAQRLVEIAHPRVPIIKRKHT